MSRHRLEHGSLSAEACSKSAVPELHSRIGQLLPGELMASMTLRAVDNAKDAEDVSAVELTLPVCEKKHCPVIGKVGYARAYSKHTASTRALHANSLFDCTIDGKLNRPLG